MFGKHKPDPEAGWECVVHFTDGTTPTYPYGEVQPIGGGLHLGPPGLEDPTTTVWVPAWRIHHVVNRRVSHA